jgi:tetratricopeptide (TPR) repeat protein
VISALLIAIGVTLLVLAGGALGWYPSRLGGPAYWIDDHLYHAPVAWLTRSPWWPVSAGAVFGVALLLSFGGYLLAARRARRAGAGRRGWFWLLLGVQAATCSWLAVQPYLSSQDIFSYAFYTHILLWYHRNPYLAVPRDFPFDPLYSAIFWKDQPSNYGPIWTYVSALAPLLAGPRVGLTILGLKAITIGSALASTPLLWSALGQLRPEQRVLGTLLFAWNPLLLLEAAEAGHNDVLMALFLVLSIWCWSRQWRTAGVLMLTLGALVKYVAILLIPLYLYCWWRETNESPLRICLRPGILSLLVTVAAFAPVYAGQATLGVVGFGANDLAYTNSPLELVFRQVRVVLGDSSQVAELPLHYLGYWVEADGSTILWSSADVSHGTGVALPKGADLLVVELPAGQWLHVYEARLGRFGYVQANTVHRVAAPRASPAIGTTEAVLEGVTQDPVAQRSNDVLRVLSLLLFLPAYWLGWRSIKETRTLLSFCISFLLIYLAVVQSWFWPWYLIWLLPFVALDPLSAAAQVALGLTATTAVLNAQPSVSPTPVLEWLYETRMVLIDGLPPLIVGVAWWKASGRRLPFRWRAVGVRLRKRGVWLRRRLVYGTGFRVGLAATVIFVGTSAVVAADQLQAAAIPPGVIAWRRDFGVAQQDYSAGEYEATVQALNGVLADRPNELAARRLRLAADLQMKRYADALPDVSWLIDAEPANPDWVLERGALEAQIQRLDLAQADFRAVAEHWPTNPAADEGVGEAAFEQGDLGAAKSWLGEALTLALTDPAARPADQGRIAREYGDVLASEGDLAGALQAYNQAVRLDPSDAQTYAARAALLRQEGRAEAIAPDLRRVLTLSGDVQQHQWAERLLQQVTKAPVAVVEEPGRYQSSLLALLT